MADGGLKIAVPPPAPQELSARDAYAAQLAAEALLMPSVPDVEVRYTDLRYVLNLPNTRVSAGGGAGAGVWRGLSMWGARDSFIRGATRE